MSFAWPASFRSMRTMKCEMFCSLESPAAFSSSTTVSTGSTSTASVMRIRRSSRFWPANNQPSASGESCDISVRTWPSRACRSTPCAFLA